jgi:16S rRNA (cytosine1402-N4)-methyltransferase
VTTEDASRPAVHRPVLLEEVVAWLEPLPGKVLVDGTVGAGGHARELAARLLPGGRLIGMDRDPAMLGLAAAATQGLPVVLVQAPYDQLWAELMVQGLSAVDGLVLDLGLSSDQLHWADRGFAFSWEGPLDMRFDPTDGPTAAELLAELPEVELARIFYEYGEERFSRRIARRIVERRRSDPVETTTQLAELVRRAIPGRRGGIDPATRVFQALRIAVNDELGILDNALSQMADWMAPGGRVAIISFHSLEDRRVKWAFRNDARWQVLTRKPVQPTEAECESNPRARSAKLRVAERCKTSTSPTSDPGHPAREEILPPGRGRRRPR